MGLWLDLTVLLLASAPRTHAMGTRGNITCYGYGGLMNYTENSQCPGSDACCGMVDTCLSNRLCHKANDPPNVFVRGPCAVTPWSTSECAEVCLTDDTGTLPRVAVCPDGSLCCETVDDCCETDQTFFLNNNGQVVTKAPSTTYSYGPSRTAATFVASGLSTTTTTTPAPSSTTPPSSSSASASASAAPSASGSSSLGTGAKIGIGVGVPVGCLALAGAAIWFCMRRRARRQQGDATRHIGEFAADPISNNADKHTYAGYGQYRPVPTELAGSTPPVELDATAPRDDGHYSTPHTVPSELSS